MSDFLEIDKIPDIQSIDLTFEALDKIIDEKIKNHDYIESWNSIRICIHKNDVISVMNKDVKNYCILTHLDAFEKLRDVAINEFGWKELRFPVINIVTFQFSDDPSVSICEIVLYIK